MSENWIIFVAEPEQPGWENRKLPMGGLTDLSEARNPVGKKPGFSIDLFPHQKPGFFKKPGFLGISACESFGQKPGWEKTWFLGWETRLGKNRVSRLGKNRVSS